MSQYNQYAKKLDAAFKAARDEFSTAYANLQKAKQDNDAAQAWQQETYKGENELRRQIAKADLLKAEQALRATENRVWADFDREKATIRADLEKAVRANSDAVDANALELMKSGILTDDDYFSLAEKYDNNPTMLRLIAKYAQEAAADKNTDKKTRGALYMLADKCRDGRNSIMRNFDDLCRVSDYCSGRAGGRYSSGHAASMADKWEQLSAAAVEGF